MQSKFLPVALAALMMGSLSACAPRDEATEGGGGGPAMTQQERAARDAQTQRRDNDQGDQLRANLSTDLTTEGRDLAEAYARVPWVHANLAAGDWERALDDTQFLNKQLDDMNRDNDISPAIKRKIAALKPHVATLTQQIQKHDKAALTTSKRLLDSFATTVNDPLVLAWMGDRTRGGGAGTGGTMHQEKK
jgi:hypothetical protein